VIFRHSSQSRFHGDRAGLTELFFVLALVFVVLMVAFDGTPLRLLAFFQDLIHNLH